MANKRDLKRTINYITSELFAETVAASLYNGKPTQEDVDGILSAIVMINGDYISACLTRNRESRRVNIIRNSQSTSTSR